MIYRTFAQIPSMFQTYREIRALATHVRVPYPMVRSMRCTRAAQSVPAKSILSPIRLRITIIIVENTGNNLYKRGLRVRVQPCMTLGRSARCFQGDYTGATVSLRGHGALRLSRRPRPGRREGGVPVMFKTVRTTGLGYYICLDSGFRHSDTSIV